jgi:putative transposase
MTTDPQSGRKAPPTVNTKPGYEALRRHRWSAPGAEYFVTFKAKRPESRLASDTILASLVQHREKQRAEGRWNVRTWVVMPDHIHVLFSSGANTALSDCMRSFKGPLTPFLRKHAIAWQDGYFEHRMRSDEDRLPVFLYVFLNPYREKLLARSEVWPGYFCAQEDWNWFSSLTNSDVPFPEWLE